MKISNATRVLSFVAAAALITSIFVPLWRIELAAPQYPEGLKLLIYPDAIKGDVDIINGLNHYIGMQTLHADNFIEFSILRYIIGAYALLVFSIVLIANKKWLNIVFAAFVLFGVVAMVDFWRWEYNYGHNLDPNAAIRVPGMSYQPPLIGFKQLLNFGAYSIPDLGGWLFVSCGALLLLGVLKENWWDQRKLKTQAIQVIAILFAFSFASACKQKGPEAIKLNKDECDHCKMTLTDARFAAELITPKSRVYKFDDIACLIGYIQENKTEEQTTLWISDYQDPTQFVKLQDAYLVSSSEIHSPMGGQTIAFGNMNLAKEFATKYKTQISNWSELQP